MKMISRFAFPALAALASCSSSTPALSCQPVATAEADYRPGDQFDVIVQSAPELSGTVTIAPDGHVYVPLAGPVVAAGRTLEAIQRDISIAFEKELKDPRLVVIPIPPDTVVCMR